MISTTFAKGSIEAVEEIAELETFMCSDPSNHMTPNTVCVNGGGSFRQRPRSRTDMA
jgi:hypothetical protein